MSAAEQASPTAPVTRTDVLRRAYDERLLSGLVVSLAAFAAVGLTWLLISHPELIAFEYELSWPLLIAALAGGALCISFFVDPRVGVVCLVGLVFLNLSEVLVRFHDMPSLLQFLFLPLVFAAVAWVDPERLRRRAGNGLTALLVAYSLLLLASTTWAGDAALADEAWLDNLKATGIYLVIVALLATPALLRVAAWTAVLAASLPAALGVYQVASGDFDGEFGGLARIKDAQIYGDVFEPRIAGPLGDPNFFAQLLLLVLPLGVMVAKNAATRRKRLLASGAVALIVAATVLTYSRGGALAFALVTLMLLLALDIDFRRLAAGVAVLAVIAALLLPADFTRRLATIEQLLPGGSEVLEPDSSFAKRRLVTTLAWMMFLDHPTLGVGAANYTVHFDDYADRVDSVSRQYADPGDDQNQYPHNLALEVGAETGLAGLMLFGAVIATCFVVLRRSRDAFRGLGDQATADLATALLIGLAGYLACGVFLHLAFPRPLWLIFGLTASLDGMARDRRAAERGTP